VTETILATNSSIGPDSILPEDEWPLHSVDFHFVMETADLSIPAGIPLVGFLVDEWTDFVPRLDEATAVAFQYTSPQAEAPQAIVLAVPWNDSPTWSADDLALILKETIELMEIRSVPAEAVVGSVLGNLLPTLFFAPGSDGKTRFPVQEQNLFDGVIAGGFHYVLQKDAVLSNPGSIATRM
jgi:hypothetical protein